jgi:hypothetical protein
VSTVRNERRNIPTTIRAAPMIGKTRYRPQRVMRMPATVDTLSNPTISGSMSKPDEVALTPCTSCR